MAEFHISEVYEKKETKEPILIGTVLKGSISVRQLLLLGPDNNGKDWESDLCRALPEGRNQEHSLQKGECEAGDSGLDVLNGGEPGWADKKLDPELGRENQTRNDPGRCQR